MSNRIDLKQIAPISVVGNGRFPLPIFFRDEWIVELCRKRTLWSRNCLM